MNPPLTSRERQVLTLVADGKSNFQIGLRLGISQLTVKRHLAHMSIKLDVGERAGMVGYGFRHGMLT